MKILIPTAKELNKKAQEANEELLGEKTKSIIDEFADKKPEELAKIYKIKEDKAKEEYVRWQNLANHSAKSYKALELFNGLMYRNISRDDFNDEDKDYIKKNVYITTALYGVINAYEAIHEHRLDFLQNVKIKDSSLKNFWREDYDKNVEKDEVIISLLSSEFEEVFSKAIRDKFIKITFMEEKNGDLKIHSTISKKARGKFLSEAIKRKITNIRELETIKFDGFEYKSELSTENNLVFVAKR
ncbi:peroxide stress protein YaaA [Gemella morbillorum]